MLVNEAIETKCRKAIGAIMYCIVVTRPDLANILSILVVKVVTNLALLKNDGLLLKEFDDI